MLYKWKLFLFCISKCHRENVTRSYVIIPGDFSLQLLPLQCPPASWISSRPLHPLSPFPPKVLHACCSLLLEGAFHLVAGYTYSQILASVSTPLTDLSCVKWVPSPTISCLFYHSLPWHLFSIKVFIRICRHYYFHVALSSPTRLSWVLFPTTYTQLLTQCQPLNRYFKILFEWVHI